jgi:RimJ/RimL family protein N-acetyltransferase
MGIADSLYDGRLIVLSSVDAEKDAPVESGWTHDTDYLRLLGVSPARPLSAWQVKKRYEKLDKEIEEEKNLFYFALRTRSENPDESRLVGFASVEWIEWNNGQGWIRLGIGDPADRGKGYGSEALRMLIRYAFGELNLYRLSASVPEYNRAALHVLQKAGFQVEVRRRKAILRDGEACDLLVLGLLRDELPDGELLK